MEQRLFLAIKLDLDRSLKNIYFTLKKALARERVKFYPMEELMVVLRYLGDIPVELVSEVNCHIAPVINASEDFDLTVSGVDIYPYDIMPRVLWFRVEQEERLMQLADKIDSVISDLTGHQEDFAFYPHVTFARIRFLRDWSVLDKIKKYKDIEPVIFHIKQIILYENIITNKGNIYKVRNRFDLLGTG